MTEGPEDIFAINQHPKTRALNMDTDVYAQFVHLPSPTISLEDGVAKIQIDC